MKPKQPPWTALACFLALTFLLSNSIVCGGIVLDRTTTIYGKVVEESRQPIDGIPILILSSGVDKPDGIPLEKAYTDKDGNYRIVMDVPKGYRSVSVTVDLNSVRTFKYKGYLPYLNGERVNDCCPLSVGDKANYDFLLISR